MSNVHVAPCHHVFTDLAFVFYDIATERRYRCISRINKCYTNAQRGMNALCLKCTHMVV